MNANEVNMKLVMKLERTKEIIFTNLATFSCIYKI